MNALDTIHHVREAARVVREVWSARTAAYVVDRMPLGARMRGSTPEDWMVLVQVARRPQERPEETADRLTRYMALHAERYTDTPRLETILERVVQENGDPT